MSVRTDPDLTLPIIPERSLKNRGPVPAGAYVPIAVALIGLTVVFVGGLKTHSNATRLAAAPLGVDTVITGAIPAVR